MARDYRARFMTSPGYPDTPSEIPEELPPLDKVNASDRGSDDAVGNRFVSRVRHPWSVYTKLK